MMIDMRKFDIYFVFTRYQRYVFIFDCVKINIDEM